MYLVGIDELDQFEGYIEHIAGSKGLFGGADKGVRRLLHRRYGRELIRRLAPGNRLDADTDVAPTVSSDAVGLLFWAENTDASNRFRSKLP